MQQCSSERYNDLRAALDYELSPADLFPDSSYLSREEVRELCQLEARTFLLKKACQKNELNESEQKAGLNMKLLNKMRDELEGHIVLHEAGEPSEIDRWCPLCQKYSYPVTYKPFIARNAKQLCEHCGCALPTYSNLTQEIKQCVNKSAWDALATWLNEPYTLFDPLNLRVFLLRISSQKRGESEPKTESKVTESESTPKANVSFFQKFEDIFKRVEDAKMIQEQAAALHALAQDFKAVYPIPQNYERYAAAVANKPIQTGRDIQPFVEILGDSTKPCWMRKHAAEALQNIGTSVLDVLKTDSEQEGLVEAIVRAIEIEKDDNAHNHIKTSAIEALGLIYQNQKKSQHADAMRSEKL